MNKPTFTFWKPIGGNRSTPRFLKPEEVDLKFDQLEKDWNDLNDIRENIKDLISKNNIEPEFFDNILFLKDVCNPKKYRDLLNRRNDYLLNHQVMDANEFSQLFWNDELKNKKETTANLVSGKYNKSDINQWILGICVFDTFLRQLKETPFFETLIRCSLQRNETNNWWKCLIPFCNNEWKYEEITDEDIEYLRKTKFNGKELISSNSLWFNILETFLVKMWCNREKYPKLCFGLVKFNDYEKDSFVCDDIKQMSADDLHDITYWVRASRTYKYFLWKDKIKRWPTIKEYNDDELEWLINLMNTWVVKLTLGVDNNYKGSIKKYVPIINNEAVKNKKIDENTNEKVLNERWYTLKILHEAWDNEELSVWEAKDLWLAFKIKWTNEWFVHGHAYSIAWMFTENGEKYVSIINPWYSWKKIVIPLKYVKDFFYVWIYWFNIDNLFRN